MEKRIVTLFIVFTVLWAYSFTGQKKAYGGDIDIDVVVIPAPPTVVQIPSTPVYYAPDYGIEIYFYSGHWWRRHDGSWFRATYYNGPWGHVDPPRIPAVLVKLPPDPHKIVRGHKRIPYGQLKKYQKALTDAVTKGKL